MIETMARSMIIAVSPDRDFTMNPYYEVERNYWEHVIRAGLTAMLEPTAAMAAAGADNLFGSASVDWSEDARVIWRAMIQAALDEKEG